MLPSYNSGPLLARTAAEVLEQWPHVWVVLDGSTDRSVEEVHDLASKNDALKVLHLPSNGGKGAAVLHAMKLGQREGFRHALVMDADGQHPASHVREFLKIADEVPGAMVLGVPVFGEDAPAERVHGRRIGNFFAELETLGGGVRDSLFGFRVYPIEESLKVMAQTPHGRRFDFDTELVVRLFWEGVQPINRQVPVFYPPRQEGGISHFAYLRDNLLLVRTHIRLGLLMLPRLVKVWKLRQKWKSPECS
ncbi:MAG: glycosyltransferase family 2 protein [Terrimicrobiaceae bacterium]